MSEVMTCSNIDENFSFSKTDCERMQPDKESDMLTGSDIEDESTVSFNDRLDIASIKSSENTICGSDDSVVSDLISSKNSISAIDRVQDSASSTIKSDTSSFEASEYLTADSTMIDTTFNILQTNVKDINTLTNDRCTSSLNAENNIDSKRVVVQILSSDAKESTDPISVHENKSARENQSTHCFRDDVCKLLTSSRPSLDYGSDTLEEKDLKETLNVPHKPKSVSSVKHPIKTERNQRRSSINPLLLYNRGLKFYELKPVYKHLKAATASALRAIHFMLYDKYELCGTEMQIARTRRRILRFSGYPFDIKSPKYQKKFKSLLKMPLEMLVEVHEAVFGKTPALEKVHMANHLIAIFLNPERYDEIISLMKQNIKFIPENEYIVLKEKAIFGPPPKVMLKKLNSDDLAHALTIKDPVKKVRMKKENIECKSSEQKPDEPSYDLPAYILKGPGKKLRHFRGIVENVKKANEKEINLLHRLLYGRDESIDTCKRNILEFSGFLDCQNEFIYNVHHTLMRLEGTEILKLCKILCLRATTNSRKRRIMKVMKYLRKPFNPLQIKVPGFRQKMFPNNPVQSKDPIPESRVPEHPLELWDEPENAECSEGGYRLRDFRKICSNIECSAPSDLIELNDLLFMKPSDDTEIHDRILNFTRFGFMETSIHYHYRKTLMFYMGPCIIRKIAKLLDIENWNLISNHEDLSGCILNFLMEKKYPDSIYVKPSISSSISLPSMHNPSQKSPTDLSKNNLPAEFIRQSDQISKSTYQENAVISGKSTVLADLEDASNNECSHADSQNKFDHFIPTASKVEEDFVPLRDFIHHPTDEELKKDIDAIVKSGLFSITLGDVVKKIYLKYAHFNLAYREQFIKSETRKIVSKLRQNAVEKMKYNSVT